MRDTVRRWPSQLLDRGVSYLERCTADTMIQIESDYARAIDPDRLARATFLTLRAEPILAARFVEHRLAPYWEEVTGLSPDAAFTLAANAAELEAFTLAPLNPAQAPRLRVCAWNGPSGARVVLKVCHHACDASGVKYVASLVSRFYRRLAAQPRFEPVPRPSERGIEAVLSALPAAALPQLYSLHLAQQERLAQSPAQTLPIDAAPAEGLRFLARTLERPTVEVLRRFAKSRGATLNDALLAAFVRTLASRSGWSGQRRLSITSTVDYRRYLPDAPRNVANLSTTVSAFPDLGMTLGDRFADTLARVNAITRVAKAGYLGIGALLVALLGLGPMRHGLARSIVREGLIAEQSTGRMENGLGNNGPLDAGDLTLDAAPESARMLPSPFYPPQFVVDVSGYAGTLTLILGAFTAQQVAADGFLDAMLAELSQVAAEAQPA